MHLIEENETYTDEQFISDLCREKPKPPFKLSINYPYDPVLDHTCRYCSAYITSQDGGYFWKSNGNQICSARPTKSSDSLYNRTHQPIPQRCEHCGKPAYIVREHTLCYSCDAHVYHGTPLNATEEELNTFFQQQRKEKQLAELATANEI